MKKNSIKILLFALALIVASCNGKSNWSYSDQDKWENNYSDCGGDAQSPIDITKAESNSSLKPLYMDYYTVDTFEIEVIPHKILKVFVPGTLIVPDSVYFGHEFHLTNFHFHTPSEHTVNGQHYPMEIHFVHKDTSGNAATVAVFVKEGKSNPALDVILKNIPQSKNKKEKIAKELAVRELLPYSVAYWYYEGSKASPPCTQGMQWYIMQEPIEASKEQIAKLSSMFGENIRKTQPLNKRTVFKFGFNN